MPDITEVGVVGAGTMGSGICEVAARAGYDVTFIEGDETLIAAGLQRVQGSLDRARSKGRISDDDVREIISRINGTSQLEELATCEIVIEAVPEMLDLKRRVFTELDRILPPTAVFATNTSAISVAEIAEATDHPERVVGLHFFNPAPIMKLVEVVTTLKTSDRTLDIARLFVAKTGKRGIPCRDRAGFIVNYLLSPYLNEAARMFEHGYASIEEIDEAMKLGAGYPMGPFELLDTIGLDVALAVQESLYEESRESRWAPTPLLKHMAAAGRLGKKSSRGFYDYSAKDQGPSKGARGDAHASGLSA